MSSQQDNGFHLGPKIRKSWMSIAVSYWYIWLVFKIPCTPFPSRFPEKKARRKLERSEQFPWRTTARCCLACRLWHLTQYIKRVLGHKSSSSMTKTEFSPKMAVGTKGSEGAGLRRKQIVAVNIKPEFEFSLASLATNSVWEGYLGRRRWSGWTCSACWLWAAWKRRAMIPLQKNPKKTQWDLVGNCTKKQNKT